MISYTLVIEAVLLAYLALQIGFVLRVLLRPHREPSSRLAWILLILAVPTIGMIVYLLFGETNIGVRRARWYKIAARLKARSSSSVLRKAELELVGASHRHLFQVGHSISRFAPAGGNAARLLPDSQVVLDTLVSDIDAANHSVHLLFYIWLDDRHGLEVAEAAKRAAMRGVAVRVMADDIGSRKLIRSKAWADMIAAGVDVARAMPVRNLFLHPFGGRVDLRNHRKLIIIDNHITYCGSQNCAAPEFLVKRKYGPWVDIMVRFDGPLARQNQSLFLQDWLAHKEEDLRKLFDLSPVVSERRGIVGQVVGTGPTVRQSAMPELFSVLIHEAREELVISTPYYVPTDSIQSALCAAAHRGVSTSIVLPERNDSWVVAAASRSYYLELLEAGVRIFEFSNGLLHAKSLTLDGEIALIGSANLDRRSFDLNYENNVLLQDRRLTSLLRTRQDEFIAASNEISIDNVEEWGAGRRLWINTVAMLGPIL